MLFRSDVAGGPYTVPSPGIFVSNINVYAGNNGSSSTDRLYVWQDSAGIPGAAILHSAGTFAMGGTRAWQTRSDIAVNAGHLTSDGYIPAGTKIWIGIFASTGVLAVEGAGSGTTQLGFTNDGDWNNNGPAGGGMGVLGAYVTYSPLAALLMTHYPDATQLPHHTRLTPPVPSGLTGTHTPIAVCTTPLLLASPYLIATMLCTTPLPLASPHLICPAVNAMLAVPAGVVTTMLPAPLAPAGTVTVIWLSSVIVYVVAVTPQTVMPVVCSRFVPVSTVVCPTGATFGLALLSVGAANGE